MRQNHTGTRNKTPSGKHKSTAEDRYCSSINKTIQYRRQERFGFGYHQGALNAMYGKSNIPSRKVAERFIKIYGVPESWK